MPTKKLSWYMRRLLDTTRKLFDLAEPVALRTRKGSGERQDIAEADAVIEQSETALECCEKRRKAGEMGGVKSRRVLKSEDAKKMAEISRAKRLGLARRG